MSTSSVIVRGPGPRDGFPDFVVKKLKSDRYGVFSGTVERRWKIGPANQRVDGKWASVLHAPDPGWGIPCVDADGEVKDGQFVTSYHYEGSTPGTPPTEEQKTFELDGTMGDLSIEFHPRFDELKARFGWDDENKRFPDLVTGSGTQATPLRAAFAKNTPSPVRSLSTWFFVGLTYRISYASKQIPDEILGKIGTLISAPPNIGKFKLPKTAQKRHWLVMGPKISLRGNCAQIAEEYLLGEPGGLPEVIYAYSQLTLK